MAIEVRQLTVKCGVSGDAQQERAPETTEETKALKDELLSECRQMFLELLRSERER